MPYYIYIFEKNLLNDPKLNRQSAIKYIFGFFIFPLPKGLSHPQVGARHQPGQRPDGWHEGTGSGGGQRRQH